MNTTQANHLLSRQELQAMLGVSRSTLYMLMRNDGLPRPIRLGPQTNRWRRHEVENWLSERPIADIKTESVW